MQNFIKTFNLLLKALNNKYPEHNITFNFEAWQHIDGQYHYTHLWDTDKLYLVACRNSNNKTIDLQPTDIDYIDDAGLDTDIINLPDLTVIIAEDF